jgi:hypothetical protein
MKKNTAFRRQVSQLAKPLLDELSTDIETSLTDVVNKAVADFFRLRAPESPMSPPVAIRVNNRDDAAYLLRLEAAVAKDERCTPEQRAEMTKQIRQLVTQLLSDEGKPVARNPPEGWRRLGAAIGVGWFNVKKTGNILQGTLEGMFERKDSLSLTGKAKFFQIQLSSDCEVRTDRSEMNTLVTAHVGDIVNLNYGPKTKELELFIDDMKRGAVIEVRIEVMGDPIRLSGGRTMDNLECSVNMVKPPSDMQEEPTFNGDSK